MDYVVSVVFLFYFWFCQILWILLSKQISEAPYTKWKSKHGFRLTQRHTDNLFKS